MSNEYGFFASKEHDRRYSADDFSAFFGDFFTNGVLGSDTAALKVSAVGDMDISIAAGTAYINGRWYRKASAQVLTLGGSDTVYGRVDAVVIRCDLEKRMVYPHIIEGIAEEAPAQPLPVRNDKCYDLVLAYINVAANCIEVTAADITDKRGFDDVCGFVTSAIDHIDTAGLFAQYEAQWELLKAGCAKDADAVIAAWSRLNTVKAINSIEPTNGEIALTQSLIPSDGTAYQMPYFVQSGTVTIDKSTKRGISITFPVKFKSAPLVLISSQPDVQSNATASTNYYPSIVNVREVTAEDFKLFAWRGSSSSAAEQLTYALPANWIAFGKI